MRPGPAMRDFRFILDMLTAARLLQKTRRPTTVYGEKARLPARVLLPYMETHR